MVKIGELLNKTSTCEFNVLSRRVRNWPSLSGYLNRTDWVVTYLPGKVLKFDALPGSERIQRRGFGIPLPLTRQQEYKAAQVVSCEPALKLLAELYDKVTLSVSSLASDKNGNTVIAVGMLAAAGLCDVSPKAVRLSIAGKEFVELLLGHESLVPAQD